MFGFDISRSPHPRALAIFSPLLSGGVFLIGSAYFKPELTAQFLAYNLDVSLRLVVLLMLSYATGMMLSVAIVVPFIVFTYLLSYFATLVGISVMRTRSKTAIEPSSRSVFRRTASVVLGSALAPQPPQASATALVEQLLAFFGKANKNQPAAESQAPNPEETQLKLEAMKVFSPDFEEQWNDIHKGLYQLQTKNQNSSDTMIGVEPILSLAGAILVWHWLSFPIPRALHNAALFTFAYIGVTLLFLGIANGINYMDGSSLCAFLFEHLVDRSKGVKNEE